MKPATRDAIVGLTALVGLVGLAAMLMLFGELRGVAEASYPIHLRIDSAHGLTMASPVRLNGVRIGRITRLRNAENPADGVDLTLEIADMVRLPRAVSVAVDKSLVGDAALDFVLEPEPADESMLAPGDHIERRATTILDELSQRLQEPIDAMSRTADTLESLARTYDDVGDNLRLLLEPRTPEEVDAGRPANIPSTIARVDRTLATATDQIESGELFRRASSMIDEASDFFGRAQQTADRWSELASHADQEVSSARANLDDLSARAALAMDQTAAAAESMRALAEGVRRGEGTLGQLASNPDLYNSLKDASDRLQRALVEFQLTMEKFKAEGIPVQF